MNDISIAFAISYANAGKYLPLMKYLDNKICHCYGIGFPRNYKFSDEPIEKMKLTKIPTRISCYAVGTYVKIAKAPQYLVYWSRIQLFDKWVAKKIASDSSKIVYTSPLLLRTVKACKKAGKIVVLEAGNSEPEREHERIEMDYCKYGITQKYVYGNPVFKNTCKKSFELADKIITISQTSLNTYIEADYDIRRLEMIPLTGTDFPLQEDVDYSTKRKAFISTAFHNFIKGTQHLLLAWKMAHIEDIPLILVGRICEDLQEFIDKYGPFDNVIFAGHQSNLKEWYKQYDAVGVLMSLSEGAGRTTPEMMSFGFPMIVSPDATCDLIVDGENGYIIDPYDEVALKNRLVWFANDWTRVGNMRDRVLASLANRSVKDFSLDVAKYLESLI